MSTKIKEAKEAVLRTIGYCEEEINKLKNDDKVKRYNEAKRIYSIARNELRKLEMKELEDRISSCDHVLLVEDERYSYRDEKHYYCPKCGLSTNFDILDEDERNIMIREYERHRHIPTSNEVCDKELAKIIIDGIIKKYPDIDGDTLVTYYNASLHNIMNKKTEEQIIKLIVRK